MHVLVTGSKGFIGSKLTEKLSGDKSVVLYDVDRKNTFDIAEFSPTVEYDTIIHTAASTSVIEGEDDPAAMWENNVGKFVQFLQAVRSEKTFFVYLSTAAVYGESDGKGESQVTPFDTQSHYGMTKLVGEMLVRKYFPTNHLILRLANVVGGLEENEGKGNAFHHFKNDTPITLYGTKAVRDFVGVYHVVDVLARVAQSRQWRGTYNIGSGEATSMIELAAQFSVDRQVPIQVAPARPGEIENSWLDCTKARRDGLIDYLPQAGDD